LVELVACAALRFGDVALVRELTPVTTWKHITTSLACDSVPDAGHTKGEVLSVLLLNAGTASRGLVANGPSITAATPDTSFVEEVVAKLIEVRVPAFVTRE
jgi:hypothetical protein